MEAFYDVSNMENVEVHMSFQTSRILSAALAVLLPTLSVADSGFPEASNRHVPRYWLTFGWLSWHVDRDERKNGINVGLGLEVEFDKRWTLSLGSYRNTFENNSVYGGALWRLWIAERTSAGLMFGVVNGYPHLNHRQFSPYAFPIFQWNGDRIGANLALIPPFEGVTKGVVALQFKLAFN